MKDSPALARFNSRIHLLEIMLATLFAIVVCLSFSTIATTQVAYGSEDPIPVPETGDSADKANEGAATEAATGAEAAAGNENSSKAVVPEPQNEEATPDVKAAAAEQELAAVEYTVRHFTVNKDGAINLVETEKLEGAEGDTATVKPKEIPGHKFEENFDNAQGEASKTTGVLSKGEELVLEAYYVAIADDPAVANADEPLSASGDLAAQKASGEGATTGTWGSCAWVIDAAGTLTVHAGIGGSASEFVGSLGENAANVKRIMFESGVVAPEDCGALFYGLSNVESIDLSNLDASNTKSTNAMFYGCSGLKTLNMSGMKLPVAEDMRAFFYGCTSLESVELSNLVVNCALNMSSMFYGCNALKTVNMSGINAESAQDMSGMFYGCAALESVDMTNLRAPKLADMRAFFYGCASLVSATLSGLDVPSVTNMSAMFSGCKSLESVDLSGINAPKAEDLGALFYECTSLTSVNLSGFNTPSLTNTGAMFSGCESLPSVDLSSLNTSNVTIMLAMFDRCKSLTSLSLANFDTSSATTMGGMFHDCSSLEALDLSMFDTSNVYSMIAMFDGCSSLLVLDISSFNTSSIFDTGATLKDLEEMLSLDLSSLGKTVMPIGLAALGLPEETIELPIFDMSSLSKIGGTLNMFSKCSSLKYISVGSEAIPLGMLPAYTINGHSDWYSTKDHKWFTSMEIDQSRLGIADTYTKFGPNPVVATSTSSSSWPLYNGSTSIPKTGDGNIPLAAVALFAAASSALLILVQSRFE